MIPALVRSPSMRLALLPAAALLALSACTGGRADTTGQVSRGFYSPDFDTVWEVAHAEMARGQFTVDVDASSKEGRILVSRWSLSLSPFAGKGYREKATVTFHEVPGQPNRWTVEANVLREQNGAMVQPSNPVVAKWENPMRVPEKERLLMSNIERFFVPRDVSPEFRSRYGMPAATYPEPAGTPGAPLPPSPKTR
jgi:hypothetical protein